MRTVPTLVLASCLALGVAIAPASGAPPQPALGQATADKPELATGFDLAVTNITTTGGQVPCVYCPIITVKNLGTKPVNGTYQMEYVCNGSLVYTNRSIVLNLAPGQTQQTEWFQGTEHNFARYGDTVQATIDINNQLREDNETNNTFQKKLLQPERKPAQQPRQPRP